MGLKKLKYFLADIGENAVEIGDNTDKIVSNTFSLQYNLAIENFHSFFSYCNLLLSSQN